jgi:opacity protein-like surface antigen
MRTFLTAAAAVAALCAGTVASADPMSSPAPAMGAMMAAPVTVKLAAQNGSGESGTATLTQTADGVLVKVNLKGYTAGVAQPNHIHKGTCEKLDPKPAYPLKTMMDGVSTTTVTGVTLADLMNGDYAINVHKSTTEIATYVACGNIPKK